MVQLVGVVSWSGWSGGGPCCQRGPGGQGGPGDQFFQCIWFTWFKQSDYRENLRCTAVTH